MNYLRETEVCTLREAMVAVGLGAMEAKTDDGFDVAGELVSNYGETQRMQVNRDGSFPRLSSGPVLFSWSSVMANGRKNTFLPYDRINTGFAIVVSDEGIPTQSVGTRVRGMALRSRLQCSPANGQAVGIGFNGITSGAES